MDITSLTAITHQLKPKNQPPSKRLFHTWSHSRVVQVMTTGGHPPPISAEVLFNVQRRGLSAEMIMSIKYASVVIQLEDDRIVQRPLTIEERRFILAILEDGGKLKVSPCTGVEFRKGIIEEIYGDSREAS